MTLGLDQADIWYIWVTLCRFVWSFIHLNFTWKQPTQQKTHRQIQASRVRCTRRRSTAMAERTRHHCCPGCKNNRAENRNWYCWWLKSCTTWDVWNPKNNGIFTISTGAGFLPSTVWPSNCPLANKKVPNAKGLTFSRRQTLLNSKRSKVFREHLRSALITMGS